MKQTSERAIYLYSAIDTQKTMVVNTKQAGLGTWNDCIEAAKKPVIKSWGVALQECKECFGSGWWELKCLVPTLRAAGYDTWL